MLHSFAILSASASFLFAHCLADYYDNPPSVPEISPDVADKYIFEYNTPIHEPAILGPSDPVDGPFTTHITLCLGRPCASSPCTAQCEPLPFDSNNWRIMDYFWNTSIVVDHKIPASIAITKNWPFITNTMECQINTRDVQIGGPMTYSGFVTYLNPNQVETDITDITDAMFVCTDSADLYPNYPGEYADLVNS